MRRMLYDYAAVTAESVKHETDAALAVADELIAKAIAAPPSFGATMLPLELAAAELTRAYGRTGFMGQVHADEAVRDAGTEAEERIYKWRVALVFRGDLYRAVRAFADSDEARGLDGERATLVEHWLRDFRRAGHELDADARAELERLRTRLVEVEVAY
jgi:thimet oligopeptidase